MASIIDAIIRLQDQFTPNLEHIRDELAETRNVSRRAARDMQSLGNSISGIGTAMLPVAGAIAGGIGIATSRFADFDYIITQAGLKAGATEAQFKQMSDTVIAAGAKYPISIQSAAEAMDRLAAGGFNAEQSMAALSPVIQAAVASGEDMAVVSDVVTSALSSWGLMEGDVAKNAEMVADVIQMASNKSKLGVQEIRTALQYAAAPAAALGDDLQTVSAILGVMANKGIEASNAGTSLRKAYLNLTAGAKPAMDAIESLGLQVFNTEGKFLGMTNLMDQLRGKLKGLTEKEATPLLRDIFGTEGISAVLAYINTAENEAHEMLDSMYNATGSSAAAFEKMNATFKGQMEAAKGAFEAFVIRVGKAAAPMLAPLVSGFQRFVKYLNELPDEKIQLMLKLGIGFIGMTGGILALGKGISLVGSLAGQLNPIGLQLAQGATLSSIFSARLGAISTSFRLIRNVGTLAMSQVLSPLRGIGNILGAPFRVAARSFSQMGIMLRSFAPASAVFRAGLNSIRESLGLIGPQGMSVAVRFAQMRAAIGRHISGILGFIRRIPQAISNFPALFTRLVSSARQLLSLRNVFMVITNGFRAFSLALASNPVGIALLAIGAAALFVAANWDTFKTVAETVWNKISYVVSEVTGNIRNRLSGLWEHGKQVFDRLVNAWNVLTGSSVQSGEVITLIINTLGAAFTAGFDIIVSVVEFAINSIFTIIDSLLTVLDGLINFITGVFTGNWAQAWEGIKTIFTGIFDGIKGIFGNFVDFLSSALDRIMGKADTASSRTAAAIANSGLERRQINENADLNPNEGHNALGTNFWRGGFTWVHEQGPEIIDLPTGSRVIPHSKSLMKEYGRGLSDGMAMVSSASLPLVGAHENRVSGSDTTGESTQSIISPDGAGKTRGAFGAAPARDSLGNITGANIPAFAIVTPEDGEEARQEKLAAQERMYMRSAPLGTGGRAAGGNAPSNIRSGDREKQTQNLVLTINIPKFADSIYVREKTDVEDIARQMVFEIKSRAINQIKGALR